MTEIDEEFFEWEENLCVAKYHFHHATASDRGRRNGASGFQIHNILCYVISFLVTSPLPHKTASESVSYSIQTKTPFSPKSKSSSCTEVSITFPRWGERNKVVQGHITALLFSESWPFKQSGYFYTRDVWKWSRAFGDIDINGGESIRKLLWHWTLAAAVQHSTIKFAFI